MFVESLSKPSTDPVIFWFDGGPGISSMVGLFKGLGPLYQVPTEDTFRVNPYTWAAQANMMFIENPAGVGFSYSATLEDTYQNDWSASDDLFNFL